MQKLLMDAISLVEVPFNILMNSGIVLDKKIRLVISYLSSELILELVMNFR